MNVETITPAALLAAAREHVRPGISFEQGVVIGYSQLSGEELDPWNFDDAAVILRAERLIHDGVNVGIAIRAARDELVRWATPEDGQPKT